MSDDGDLRRHTLRLTLVEGVGPLLFRRIVEAFGGLAEAAAASARQVQRVEGVGPKTAAAWAAVTSEMVEEELSLVASAGARLLCRDDADYPAALRPLADAPPALYVRGHLRADDAVAVAIVGSRRCTHYGLEQAARFGGLLGRAGFTVVSGGARGIDAAAHQGALDAAGRTLAVMGCGLCRTYPPENAALFDRIVAEDRGALLSELPMRTAVLAGNFPSRNRIIAALGLGVLVVEAARRSGSLITAAAAIEQGREVFALPGRVDSPFSQGANQLIARHEALLVQDLDDILNALDRVGETITRSGGAAPPPPPRPEVSPAEAAILRHLEGAELSLDELVRRTSLPAHEVTATMTLLAVKALVVQKAGGVFAARRP